MAAHHFILQDQSSLLLIRGSRSFLLAGTAGSRFPLCIEHASGEVCITLEEDDIIAVSAPEGGPLEPAVMLFLLVKTYQTPLLVLPPGHPGSKRLRYVVSAGHEIALNCGIQRGTHPEQHLLCSSDELAGMVLSGTGDGIQVCSIPADVTAACITIPPFPVLECSGKIIPLNPEHPDAG